MRYNGIIFRLAILIIMNPLPAFPQIDTLRALSYFPMQTGNKWQYEDKFVIDGYVEYSYKTMSVLGDTLMPNNRTYRMLENDSRLFRVDSSELKVYLYFPDGESCPDSETVYFDLVYPDSGFFTTCYNYEVQVDTGHGEAGYLPMVGRYIAHHWYDGISQSEKLHEGIGISEWSWWEIVGSDGKLLAATIDSVQYGTYVVDISADEPVPREFELEQNFPNPFNPSTTINYSLSTEGNISVAIRDILGRQVKQLTVHSRQARGKQAVQWDGTNQAGEAVVSGVYIYQLTLSRSGLPGISQSRKMLLIR